MGLFNSPSDGASLPVARPVARVARPWIESGAWARSRGLVSVHGPADDPFGGTLGRTATASLLGGWADDFDDHSLDVAEWVWERLGDPAPGLRDRGVTALAETVRWLCHRRGERAFASVLPYRPRTGGGGVVRKGVTSWYRPERVPLRPHGHAEMTFGDPLPVGPFDFVDHGHGSGARVQLLQMRRVNRYAPAGGPPFTVVDTVVCPVAERDEDDEHLAAGLIAPLAAGYFDPKRGLWLCPHVLFGAVGLDANRYTCLVHLCLSAEGRLISLSTNERTWEDFCRYFPAYGPMLAATGRFDGP